MLELFSELGYTQFGIKDFKFIQELGKQHEEGDFFFVPEDRLAVFKKQFSLSEVLSHVAFFPRLNREIPFFYIEDCSS
jgi:hypothetical protein